MSLVPRSARRTLPATPGVPRFLSIAVIGLLAAVVVGACTTGPGATTAPTAAPTAAATTAPTAAPASASPPASPAGQTQIDWGRIWDALPPSFPIPPGSVPTETGAGPATATLQLGTSVEIAADWWQEALEAVGYRIEARNTLEDGSIVIDAVGNAGCRAQASIAPLGGVTVGTIFVGAECPFS